ncbi:uncharacterized protein LOC123508707 [Portunus trituberculatus]|uniref:uncharacterized protein LOC123508707 n=1 Tax=Portunus trituberculatus TaxID=210409 RepID=UPI001E1D163B|nr:uncharacterized protein LOC123508707 [Portunus trituberculatus]
MRFASRTWRMGVHSRPFVAIQAALPLLLLALPAINAQRDCSLLNCDTICDEDPRYYRPQDCTRCCPDQGKEEDKTDEAMEEGIKKLQQRMEEMEQMMRVMMGVSLGLLLLLIVLVVVVLLRQTSTKALKAALPVFFKKKDEGRASIEKRPLPPTKVPPENRNSTVLRIADYQNNHSPLTKRTRPNGMAQHRHGFPMPPEEPRPRQPSESTCPDESDLSQPHQDNNLPPGAYDNLALSHTSSTSTLAPAVSTNTLDTTLPSMNPTSLV